jgi:hypothetical protein
MSVSSSNEEEPALRFERYLKSGSGREFARRHFHHTVRPLASLAREVTTGTARPNDGSTDMRSVRRRRDVRRE